MKIFIHTTQILTFEKKYFPFLTHGVIRQALRDYAKSNE